jgi:hypothetical protein
MLALIERPLSWREAAIAAALLFALGAAYCLAFTYSAGLSETPFESIAWTSANLLPWLAAVELAKRRGVADEARLPRAIALAAILIGAGLLSLLLETGFGFISWPDSGKEMLFEALRRVPGAILVLLLMVMARSLRGRRAARSPTKAAGLPLLPRQIDWIKAAGNYLEFHHATGLVMGRMTIKQAETMLVDQGFVRIHRSLLVNATRLARVHVGKLADEVELVDGTRLKVGGAYRAQLRRIALRAAA